MHHPATRHETVRPTILTAVNNPEYRKLFVKQNLSSSQKLPSSQINVKSGRKNKDQTTKIHATLAKMSVTTKSVIKNLILTPKFQNTITARGAYESYGKGVLDLQLGTYLLAGRIPAKATKLLK
jgi:hypothetical protein